MIGREEIGRICINRYIYNFKGIHFICQILGDETKQACYECDQLIHQINESSPPSIDDVVVRQIHQITHHINNNNTQLQVGHTIFFYYWSL